MKNSTDEMDEKCKSLTFTLSYLRVILAVLIDGDLIFLIAFLQVQTKNIGLKMLPNFFVHICDGFLLDFKILKF